LVDGFEFDPYFVEIANLVTAATGTTRVSFFQRDISRPESYPDGYDIVLAFAVFGQGVRACLSRVAEITDVLVVETHRLDGNFAHYMDPVTPYFPAYRVIGQTEWGSVDNREVRAVVVFAKDEDLLSRTLKPRAAEGGVPDQDQEEGGTARASKSMRYIDVARTPGPERFFEHFAFDSPDELLAAIDGMDVDLDTLVRIRDLRAEYTGWVYWFLYVKGYCQYSKTKEVSPGNVYFDYLLRYPKGDPVLTNRVSGPEETAEHVVRQFRDMDRCRFRDSDAEAAETVPPTHAVISERPLISAMKLFERDRPDPLPAKLFDGWHRLFGARLFGVPALRCVVHDEAGVGPILGSIEVVEQQGREFKVEGWCLDPQGDLDRFGISTHDRLLPPLREAAIERPDVGRAFPHLPHAVRSGFSIHTAYWPSEVEHTLAEITIFGDWHAPVGKMKLQYIAGMLDDVASPPAELAHRFYGVTDGRALAVRAHTAVEQMLEPIRRYRSLKSFRNVLDFGCGTGLLEPAIHRTLGAAKVTAVEFDPDAVEWCRSAGLGDATFCPVEAAPPADLPANAFDLVLASDVFPRLDADHQHAWLQDLHRVTEPGGYVAITVLGELARRAIVDPNARRDGDDGDTNARERTAEDEPDLGPISTGTTQTRADTVAACERWFDVIQYLEGAVVNQLDLVVLRKR
jgi:SAM-dependent methyltransferase